MTALDVIPIGLQIVLPVVLIAWLAAAPIRNRIGFLAQAAATGLALLTLLLIAVWIIPPWWSPHLYLATWFGVLIWRVPSGLGRQPWLPEKALNWAGAAVVTGLGALFAFFVVQGLQGRNPPNTHDPVDLTFPLGPGTYLVASGGAHQILNGHFLTLAPKTPRQAAYRGQSYGVDLIRIDRLGLRAHGWRPRDPAAYAIFGEPVHAPCSGTVIEVSDSQPDMPVPMIDSSQLEGNHVMIRCGEAGVLLAHFKQGSVAVAPGDRVATGQKIGEVGNSGQTTEPHLHVHVQRLAGSGPPISGEPLFLTFDGRFPVRNDRFSVDAARAAKN